MNDKFDKDGKPLGLMEWAKLLEDKEYKIIKQETVPDGKWVSTVWLGLDHSFGDGPPLIFETMVFRKKPLEQKAIVTTEEGKKLIYKKWLEEWHELDMQRYSTLEEAQKGHEEMVKKYS